MNGLTVSHCLVLCDKVWQSKLNHSEGLSWDQTQQSDQELGGYLKHRKTYGS